MNGNDPFQTALDVFGRNLAEGRLAHAFVVQGPPAGDGRRFAEAALQTLFCEGLTKPCGECRECEKVSRRTHPDIQWLEPQKKSRTFDVEKQIRPMLRDFAQTSYQGGWKAVVIVEADRLNDSHANAILKALEEPGKKRLWLLLTAHPDQLLTTIHSRCQRFVLSSRTGDFEGSWVAPLREWLRGADANGGLSAIADASFLTALLGQQEKEIAARLREEIQTDDENDPGVEKSVFEARVRSQLVSVRNEILTCITLWRRDVLACAGGGEDRLLYFPEDASVLREQAARLGFAAALRSVQRVSDMSRRFDRNMPAQQVFEASLI